MLPLFVRPVLLDQQLSQQGGEFPLKIGEAAEEGHSALVFDYLQKRIKRGFLVEFAELRFPVEVFIDNEAKTLFALVPGEFVFQLGDGLAPGFWDKIIAMRINANEYVAFLDLLVADLFRLLRLGHEELHGQWEALVPVDHVDGLLGVVLQIDVGR